MITQRQNHYYFMAERGREWANERTSHEINEKCATQWPLPSSHIQFESSQSDDWISSSVSSLSSSSFPSSPSSSSPLYFHFSFHISFHVAIARWLLSIDLRNSQLWRCWLLPHSRLEIFPVHTSDESNPNTLIAMYFHVLFAFSVQLVFRKPSTIQI